MKTNIEVEILGQVRVKDKTTGELLREMNNSVHPQNMSRAISQGLAHRNGSIYRIALGNGASIASSTGETVVRPPQVNTWESRLYNETFSEVIDRGTFVDCVFIDNPDLGTGTGTVPSSDSVGEGVVAQEVGTKSTVTLTVFLNEDEPTGQLSTANLSAPTNEEKRFIFDEIGLYTQGKPPIATSGISSVNVNNKTSTDEINLPVSSILTLNIMVDGISYTSQITTPAGGTGVGGALTYGDFCEGINTGTWITAGDNISAFIYVFITDRNNFGTYPSIIGKESFGFLSFQSKTTGNNSNVTLICNDQIAANIFNIITSGICANVNINQKSGDNAGVQIDDLNPCNERERLLTHLVFSPPIAKTSTRGLIIEYILTITVKNTQNSRISQVNL